MINRPSAWEEIQPNVEQALEEIQSGFSELFRSDPNREGWGQYIDPPPHRDHTGVYGTGSGIQVCSMSDSGAHSQKIKTAQEWLIDQWNREDSETTENGYKHIIYKHAFCLFGLSRHNTAFTGGSIEYDDRYTDDVDDVFNSLWDKRIPKQGWGQYWFESDPDEMDLECSALAAMALLSHENIRRNSEYEDILKNIGKKAYRVGTSINRKNVGNGINKLLTVAFCLLALTRYRNVVGDGHVDKETENRIKQLGNIISNQVSNIKEIDENTYSISLISLPESDELPDEANEEHYMIFLVHPIVTLALLEAGSPFIGRNRVYIRNIVDQYTDSILGSDKNCFSSSDTSRCSTHDHLWLAAMLNKYAQTNIKDETLLSRARGHLRGKYVSIISTFGFAIAILAVSIGAAFYDQPSNPAWVRAVSSAGMALTGALVKDPVLSGLNYLKRRVSPQH